MVLGVADRYLHISVLKRVLFLQACTCLLILSLNLEQKS